jgi:hypothetical protein
MVFHGIVERGAIKLPPGVELPEGAEVRIDILSRHVGDNGLPDLPTRDEGQLDIAQEPLVPSEAPAMERAGQQPEPEDEPEDGYALNRELLKFAGIIKDLPPDFSINHDHYLYGVPKRE